MYRPSIGPASAIERAIVRRACEKCPDLADLRRPISRGFLHTATSGGAPGFFYARCARNQVYAARRRFSALVNPKNANAEFQMDEAEQAAPRAEVRRSVPPINHWAGW